MLYLNGKFRTITGVSRSQSAMHASFNDVLGQEQAYAGSMGSLGGEIGVEYLLQYICGNPSCIVADSYYRFGLSQAGSNKNPPVMVAAPFECIPGIHQYIEENLGVFVLIAIDDRIVHALQIDCDLVVVEAAGYESYDIGNNDTGLEAQLFLVRLEKIPEIVNVCDMCCMSFIETSTDWSRTSLLNFPWS